MRYQIKICFREFYFYDGTVNLRKDEMFIPHHYKNDNVKNAIRNKH